MYSPAVPERSQWKLRALKAHPEVKDLKERVTPIDRAAAFGRAYYSNTSEVTETVSPAIIMELVRLACTQVLD